jgi:hypothetical protein
VAGYAEPEYLVADAPEGFEFTGEYRRPQAGEFFLYVDNTDLHNPNRDRSPRALRQTATREEGHRTVGDGLGYVEAARRILVEVVPPILTVRAADNRRGDDPYPLTLVKNGSEHLFKISIEEAEELAGDLREEIAAIRERRDMIENGPFVQVRFEFSAYPYTYRDPSGTLAVGDQVEAPTTRINRRAYGEVIALGRGDWDGPVKDVTARITREELAA